MCPADTTPEAWRVFLELQRRMSPREKMERTLEISERLRAFAQAGVRQRYPQANEREVFLRVARLALGPELFRLAYGDVLTDHGSEERT